SSDEEHEEPEEPNGEPKNNPQEEETNKRSRRADERSRSQDAGEDLTDEPGHDDPTDHEPEDTTGQPDQTFDPDERDVILCGSGLELTYDLEVEPTKRLFAYYQIPLSEEGWTNNATGQPATKDEMKKALGSLDALLIRAEYQTGAENDDIDNVILRQRP
ncbi:MAG TPA: laminin B domain-containing protein, partial [Rubrobacter sp.]|nr:laminin B domain-containing protein [Rubrobacter sp.]